MQHLPAQFTKHSVVVNGTRIAVAVGGTGKPVLLLHGWPQTADAWNKVMGPLAARGWKVIAPDLRGTGDSARATSGYAKDDQAEDTGFAHYRTLLADGQANRNWGDAGGILSMPVLAVGGEHNAGTRLADALRPVAMDLTPAVIAGSGHFVPEEQPKRLLAVLDSFLGDPAVPQG